MSTLTHFFRGSDPWMFLSLGIVGFMTGMATFVQSGATYAQNQAAAQAKVAAPAPAEVAKVDVPQAGGCGF